MAGENGEIIEDAIDPEPLPEFAVGCSPAWTRVVRKVQRVTLMPTTVLIRGETGSGKEIVAKLIVALGPRAGRPFISLNCAALTETLLESELFGHVRGAFTSATTPRKGLFEEASGGTLFLDEIGAVPLASQSKLLRVLDEGRIRRVGDNRFQPVDTRILAATNLDLEAAIGRHEFREDLYYRLSVVTLDLPPLRERREDIPLLAAYFLERLEKRGFPVRRLSAGALELLQLYSFPGNIRELKHAIEQAVIFSSGEELTPADFSQLAARRELLLEEQRPVPRTLGSRDLDAITPREIVEVLRSTRNNRVEAAKLLGISRSSFYRILRRMSESEPPVETGSA